ncbi:MAG: hypothetical protein U5Q03_09890 [Bacteroidota bacterium]|nr:hypothetical protein [Bacteroidota bacterium]
MYYDTIMPGALPQGGIINPYWNTEPDDAIYTDFSPGQDGSNGTYGGYAYGINPLTQSNPSNPTVDQQTSGEDITGDPQAFTISSEGKVFMVDPCFPDDQNFEYNGNLILEKESIMNRPETLNTSRAYSLPCCLATASMIQKLHSTLQGSMDIFF